MWSDIGLLLLRLGAAGLLFFGHGWSKLIGFSGKAAMFPDPLRVGSTMSLGLATFAEAVCTLAVLLGVYTRLAAIPPLITMLVAAIVIHVVDPWQQKELPLLFAFCFATIALTGPGSFSVDWMVRKKK